jgi:hypothetical protein
VRLASYLWQFYLPRLPGQGRWTEGYPVFDVWIRQTWAAFGWLEVQFRHGVYVVFAAVTIAVAVAACVALWRARRRIDRALLAFLALAVLCLLVALHWTDYHQLREGRPFMQGRYLFPLVALAGAAAACALHTVPERRRRATAGAALGALCAFNAACFVLVLERFYA